jgi:phage gp46-like protein
MAIGFVQVNYNGATSGLTTSNPLVMPAAANFTAGNCLIALGAWGQTSGVPTVTTTGGTGSDTFTSVYSGGPDSATGSSTNYGIWVLRSVGSGRTGIQVSYPSNPTGAYGDIVCYEVSGLPSASLDKAQFATALGSVSPYVTASTGTLNATNEFCVEYSLGTSSSGAASAPWIDMGQTIPGTAGRAGYQIVSSNAAIFGSMDRGSNTNGFIYCATFRSLAASQGAAAGTGAAAATGIAILTAIGAAGGGANAANAVGSAQTLARGSSIGAGSANASSLLISIGRGAAAGTGAATAVLIAPTVRAGSASGFGVAIGVGFASFVAPPITVVPRKIATASPDVPDIRLVQNRLFPQYSVTVDWSLLSDGTLDDTQALATAVIVALGTNALAGDFDVLPDPDSNDRMGWWGDLDAATIWGGWNIGSKLWLLQRSKIVPAGPGQPSTLMLVENYIRDAIQPFVDRKICSSFNVWTTRVDTQRIDALIRLYRGPQQEIELRYQVLWNGIVI